MKSGGAPFFAWTEDIYTASPIWQENSAGLPAAASSVRLLKLDPANPATRAYLVVDDVLFRDDGLRTGGRWAAVLTPGGSIYDAGLTIAQPRG